MNFILNCNIFFNILLIKIINLKVITSILLLLTLNTLLNCNINFYLLLILL